jgi:formate hydrogenlyase subunit 4
MNALGGAIQVGAVALAPLLPGLIQTLKARLQGRRGASPLQPYRTLRRLWWKSTVEPEGAGVAYRLAPAVVAACLLIALALVPVGGRAADWGLGNDALVLVGLLALARFAPAAAAWDPGNGFALMGVARDLMLAVVGEALLALALVVLVETGRQPIDNPDTHLELTMIHEGPLLEYAGRDLAFLQWAAAARHWVVLVLGAELFLPHWGGFAASLGVLAAEVVALCGALGFCEIAQAKMRILRVPALLGLGCAIALAGAVSYVAGVGT